jgi:hypothetical protein
MPTAALDTMITCHPLHPAAVLKKDFSRYLAIFSKKLPFFLQHIHY